MTSLVSPVEVAYPGQAVLGEGPLWDGDVGVLRWVDINGQKLHEFDPASGENRSISLNRQVTAVALSAGEPLLLALSDRLARFAPGEAAPVELGNFRVDRAKLRFNDGKVDPWGGFQVGTMHHGGDEACGSLYRLAPDLSVVELIPAVTCSNGLDWSADRSLFFHVDSVLGRVDRYATDPGSGEMTGRAGSLVVESPGIPDGMSLDVDGCLWIAMWGGGEVRRLTPEGTVDRIVKLPVSQVTSVTFGGAALDELFITTARDGLSESQLAKEPHAGDLFWCRPGTSGYPAHRFGGAL